MICPRCRTPDPERMKRSQDGSWEIYLCHTCYYAWRTTEPKEVIDPELYDERFRINPEDIASFMEFPRVPPMSQKKNG